jgi:branched-chain amino acid transport system substrate-binding protein
MQAIILAVVIVIAAVGTAVYYYMTMTPQYTAEPIKIGVIANAGWPVGLSGIHAVQLAVDEINGAGGILGRNITLIVEDSKGEVPTATAAYKKLVVTDRVAMVVVVEGGTVTLACMETGAGLYPEYPHLMFNAGASAEPIATNIKENYNKYKFTINPYQSGPDRLMNAVLMNTLLARLAGAKKIAIIGEDLLDYAPYWEGWPAYGYRPYADYLKDVGFEVVYTSKIAVGEKNFLPIFEAIAASGAEYIDFAMSAYSDFYTLAKQWAVSAAKDIPIFHSGVSPKYWETTGGACLGMIGWWPSDFGAPPNPSYEVVGKTKKYITAFYERYGYAGSNWLAEGAYDDVLFFAEIVKAVGKLDVESLIKKAEEIEVEGVRGLMKINPKDHTTHETYPVPGGFIEDMIKVIVEAPFDEITPRMRQVAEKYGRYPYFIYPISPVAPLSQWQKNGSLVILFPPEVVNQSNPGKGYISPAELRAG